MYYIPVVREIVLKHHIHVHPHAHIQRLSHIHPRSKALHLHPAHFSNIVECHLDSGETRLIKQGDVRLQRGLEESEWDRDRAHALLYFTKSASGGGKGKGKGYPLGDDCSFF